eukprot:1189558-Prorocentrum_minimum.AAC.4
MYVGKKKGKKGHGQQQTAEAMRALTANLFDSEADGANTTPKKKLPKVAAFEEDVVGAPGSTPGRRARASDFF